MKRLRLLLLTRFPLEPPLIGASVRNLHLIQSLGKHHDITVLSFAYDAHLRHIKRLYGRFCEAIILVKDHWPQIENLNGLPGAVKELSVQPMLDALEWLDTATYDGVIIDTIHMAAFRPYIYTTPILIEHNIESELLHQAGSKTEAVELAEYETSVWPLFPLRTVVSDHDQAIMARRVPGQILVVPNGADPEIWIPQLQQQSHQLLFMGTLHYSPNVQGICTFVEQIWPLIHQQQPKLKLLIAGRSPVPEVRQLARYPGIEVIADFADVRSLTKQCSISIVPLYRGSGTRLKILESMAIGMPIVTTSIGCEGLSVEDGKHLLIRDDPEAFAEAVLEIDRDPNLWQALRTQGRNLLLNTYTWEQCYRPLDQRLREML